MGWTLSFERKLGCNLIKISCSIYEGHQIYIFDSGSRYMILSKGGVGICWQIYPYCQYDSMVYNQTLSTETFQVLYIDDHFTPIYIYILSVRTLNFVIDNAELEIFHWNRISSISWNVNIGCIFFQVFFHYSYHMVLYIWIDCDIQLHKVNTMRNNGHNWAIFSH